MIVIDAPGAGALEASRRALFLDRDGVINHDHGYVHRIEDFDFIDGILSLGREAIARDYLLVVVTNQSGIARGYYSADDFRRLSGWMMAHMAEAGAAVARVSACPHLPSSGCSCRKPQPGLILEAAKDLGLDLRRSILLGDKASDIEAAARAGIGARLLYAPPGAATDLAAAPHATQVVTSMAEIVSLL